MVMVLETRRGWKAKKRGLKRQLPESKPEDDKALAGRKDSLKRKSLSQREIFFTI